jgi:hypothetical protein
MRDGQESLTAMNRALVIVILGLALSGAATSRDLAAQEVTSDVATLDKESAARVFPSPPVGATS